MKDSAGRVELQSEGKSVNFRLVGVLDERVDLSLILTTIRDRGTAGVSYSFDLGEIERINSLGVLAWIKMMTSIPPELKCTFVNVSEVMIQQANMAPGVFKAKGSVLRTFQAPYFCKKCDKPVLIMLEPSQVHDREGVPVAPAADCPACKSKLGFDWIEDEYFSFLKRL